MAPIANRFRSGPDLVVDVAGAPEASQMLMDAAARGEDMRPAMERVKLLFIEGHTEQFSSKGGFLGTPWPPLSPETIARKSREGIPSPSDTLVSTGNLRQSLEGGAGRRTRISKGSVSVGTKNFYAIFTQGGASGARRGEQPARPVLGISEGEREESLSILTDYLLGRAI